MLVTKPVPFFNSLALAGIEGEDIERFSSLQPSLQERDNVTLA
jgi:hypothetical protein